MEKFIDVTVAISLIDDHGALSVGVEVQQVGSLVAEPGK